MSTTVQYQVDADMLGPEFKGSCRDLGDLIPHLSEATGRPESAFLVRQHISQWSGAEEPSEQEWLEALEAFAEEHPELF